MNLFDFLLGGVWMQYVFVLLLGLVLFLTPLFRAEKAPLLYVHKVTCMVICICIASLAGWALLVMRAGDDVPLVECMIATSVDLLSMCSLMLIGEAMLNPSGMNVWIYLTLFVPFIILTLLMLLLKDFVVVYVDIFLCVVYMSIMLGRQWVMVSHHDNELQFNYSEVDSRMRLWYKKVMVALIVLVTVYLVFFFLFAEVGLDPELRVLMTCIYDITGSVIWLHILHNLLLFREDDNSEVPEPVPDPAAVSALPDDVPAWALRLNDVMENEKPYLQSEITVSGLAKIIGTNSRYLSAYLNGEKSMNFYEYINGYRLEYAIEKMKNESALLSDIARESGFFDMRTFRKAFQSKFGCLPSEWRASHGSMNTSSPSSEK